MSGLATTDPGYPMAHGEIVPYGPSQWSGRGWAALLVVSIFTALGAGFGIGWWLRRRRL